MLKRQINLLHKRNISYIILISGVYIEERNSPLEKTPISEHLKTILWLYCLWKLYFCDNPNTYIQLHFHKFLNKYYQPRSRSTIPNKTLTLNNWPITGIKIRKSYLTCLQRLADSHSPCSSRGTENLFRRLDCMSGVTFSKFNQIRIKKINL